MKLISSCGLSSHVSFACLLAGMKIVHDIKPQGLSADWTSGLDVTLRRIRLAIVVVLDQNFSVSDICGFSYFMASYCPSLMPSLLLTLSSKVLFFFSFCMTTT